MKLSKLLNKNNDISNKTGLYGAALELYLDLLSKYKESLKEKELQDELIELLKTKNKELALKNYSLIKDYNALVKEIYKK